MKCREEIVAKFVQDRYNIAGSVVALPGEQDENWLIIEPEQRHVLRISSYATDFRRIDFVTAILRQLNSSKFRTPTLIKGQGGSDVFEFTDAAGHVRPAWLTSFIAGDPLSSRVLSTDLAWKLGRTLVELDGELAKTQVPDEAGFTPWDLTRPQHAILMVGETKLGSADEVIRKTLERFAQNTLPVLADMPQTTIHNDANLDNVFYDPATSSFGFIDFGDAVRAPRVIEVAVAASYFVPQFLKNARPMALDALISGYRSLQQLTISELRIIPECIRSRLALAIGIATYRSMMDPSNSPYVLRQVSRARARLDALNSVTDAELLNRWEPGMTT